MKKKVLLPFFFLGLSLVLPIINYSQVLSWSFNHQPSLVLTDQEGLIVSNNALMVDPNTETNYIRIEDMVLTSEKIFEKAFVRFKKKSYTSYVKVRVYDVFTDRLIRELDFYETEMLALDQREIASKRIYFVVEPKGSDVELQSVGVVMKSSCIMSGKDLQLNLRTLQAKKDLLKVNVLLKEEAEISLMIYDKNGNIQERFLNNNILNPGVYEFYFDPETLDLNYLSDKVYYIWVKAENLRSPPIEYVKQFQVIP